MLNHMANTTAITIITVFTIITIILLTAALNFGWITVAIVMDHSPLS